LAAFFIRFSLCLLLFSALFLMAGRVSSSFMQENLAASRVWECQSVLFGADFIRAVDIEEKR
jgi:hypothetical protein